MFSLAFAGKAMYVFGGMAWSEGQRCWNMRFHFSGEGDFQKLLKSENSKVYVASKVLLAFVKTWMPY
jgi:hypothetical protein